MCVYSIQWVFCIIFNISSACVCILDNVFLKNCKKTMSNPQNMFTCKSSVEIYSSWLMYNVHCTCTAWIFFNITANATVTAPVLCTFDRVDSRAYFKQREEKPCGPQKTYLACMPSNLLRCLSTSTGIFKVDIHQSWHLSQLK